MLVNLKNQNVDFILNILYYFKNLPFPICEIILKIFHHNFVNYSSFVLK